MMMPRIHVYETISELSRDMAAELATYVRGVLARNESFSLVLSGGNTPREFYSHLAAEYRDRIPWERIRFYWSDERYVPHDSSHSNYRMARETLLDHLPILPEHIFPMPTDLPEAGQAADAYERLLKSHFNSPWPRFDFMLLGLGGDGHLASLFPHTAALHEKLRWVAVGEAPDEPRQRLSLTLPVINAARRVHFLVSGEGKAEAFRRAAQRIINIDDCPACAIRLQEGEPEWWVDKGAAGVLFRPK